jgi:hypothetical protein
MKIHVLPHTTEQEQKFFSAWYQCVSCKSTSPRFKFPISCATSEIKKATLEVALYRAEPKNCVLTMEELKAYCEGGADAAPLWYESKDYSDVNRWMVIDLPKHAFGSAATVNCFVNGHFFEPTYGEEWRCWLRKPTKEEMEGTPWA